MSWELTELEPRDPRTASPHGVDTVPPNPTAPWWRHASLRLLEQVGRMLARANHSEPAQHGKSRFDGVGLRIAGLLTAAMTTK
jgi:hypothetical protein